MNLFETNRYETSIAMFFPENKTLCFKFERLTLWNLQRLLQK